MKRKPDFSRRTGLKEGCGITGMKTVLILANASTGVYDFRNELMLALMKKYKVVISVPDDLCTKELEEEGCEIIHTPLDRRGMNPIKDAGLFLSYLKLLKKVKPDLVLTYTIKPNIYGGCACRWKKIPYITTITGLGSAFRKSGIIKTMIIRMYRAGLKGAECVFFQNSQNREIFQGYGITGKKDKLVSGSGVNLEVHCPEEYPRDETIRFLFVGRIMKEKGIEELLAAAKALHSEHISFELLGYCDEDYQEILDEYESQGIIRQHGFHTDVQPFLQKASALVLPTYHEGMSNVLMEASASARPVIASDISGCKEIFEEGVTGFGCEPQNAESLMSAIKKFLALSVEERARMGHLARKKMEKEFDRRTVTASYMEEINQLLIFH